MTMIYDLENQARKRCFDERSMAHGQERGEKCLHFIFQDSIKSLQEFQWQRVMREESYSIPLLT